MREGWLTRCAWQSALVVATLGVMQSCAGVSVAGIVGPTPIGYGAKDLDCALGASKARGESSAPKNSQQTPLKESDRNPGPVDQLHGAIPGGQSSSSSSSSSTSGPAGSGGMLRLFNSTITVADDSPRGRIPEEHGLFLPDPPGTDLLRPPRHA